MKDPLRKMGDFTRGRQRIVGQDQNVTQELGKSTHLRGKEFHRPFIRPYRLLTQMGSGAFGEFSLRSP